jgi:hypothetical protein
MGDIPELTHAVANFARRTKKLVVMDFCVVKCQKPKKAYNR